MADSMPPKKESQNIQVCVRCRPLNSYERNKGSLTAAECTSDRVIVRERNAPSAATKTFTFDKVFGPLSKQQDVYRTVVKPMVEEVLEGYNCTVFAYGQTGTGKTFTMIGERSDQLKYSWEDDPLSGIIPRSLSHLFDKLESNGCEFSVRVSFMELYNEELFDLLSSNEDAPRLKLYDDANRKGSVMVQGLEEAVVTNKDAVYSIIERGMNKRATASTLLNAQSSRSHSVFTVTVHMRENSVDGEELVKIGKLNLVDLAGSENIGRSGAMDKRAREAGNINQSLLTLGRVITALVERTPHVPYRESKLTRILQDSLGGRTKTSIIATVSPSSLNLEETLSTLDYAHRAKNIQNKPEVNQKLSKKALLREYSDEVERLRRDLQAARDKNGFFIDVENYNQLQTTMQQQRERLKEQEALVALLRADFEKMTDVLTLTQEDLDAVRQAKELLEVDLEATKSLMARVRQRLFATEVRRREERFVKEAHQSTEDKLSTEAGSLLETAEASTGDVSALHSKVDRMRTTERDNRSRIEVFSEEVSDRTESILAHVKAHGADASSSLTSVQAALGGLSGEVHDWCSSSRARLSEFGHHWHSEAADFKALCGDHASQARSNLGTLSSRNAELLATKRRHIADVRASVQGAIGVDLSSTIRDHSVQIAEAETRLHVFAAKTQTAWLKLQEVQKSHENALQEEVTSLERAQASVFDGLRSKIEADFDEEKSTMQQFISGLKTFILKSEAKKQQHLLMLKSAQEAARSQLQEVVERIRQDMAAQESQLEGLRSEVEDGVKQHSESLSQIQKACCDLNDEKLFAAEAKILGPVASMDEALGAEVAGLGVAIDDERNAAGARAEALVSSVQQRLEPPVSAVTSSLDERTAGFEAKAAAELDSADSALRATCDTTERDLETLQTELNQMRASIASFLEQDVRATLATGQTPARRVFEYPRQLSRTSPQARLVERFRAQLDQRDVEAVCDLDDIAEDNALSDSLVLRPKRPSSGVGLVDFDSCCALNQRSQGSSCTEYSSRPNSPAENVDPLLQAPQNTGKTAAKASGPQNVARKKPLKTKN